MFLIVNQKRKAFTAKLRQQKNDSYKSSVRDCLLKIEEQQSIRNKVEFLFSFPPSEIVYLLVTYLQTLSEDESFLVAQEICLKSCQFQTILNHLLEDDYPTCRLMCLLSKISRNSSRYGLKKFAKQAIAYRILGELKLIDQNPFLCSKTEKIQIFDMAYELFGFIDKKSVNINDLLLDQAINRCSVCCQNSLPIESIVLILLLTESNNNIRRQISKKLYTLAMKIQINQQKIIHELLIRSCLTCNFTQQETLNIVNKIFGYFVKENLSLTLKLIHKLAYETTWFRNEHVSNFLVSYSCCLDLDNKQQISDYFNILEYIIHNEVQSPEIIKEIYELFLRNKCYLFHRGYLIEEFSFLISYMVRLKDIDENAKLQICQSYQKCILKLGNQINQQNKIKMVYFMKSHNYEPKVISQQELNGLIENNLKVFQELNQ